MDYWKDQVNKLKQKTTKELEQLIETMEEFLNKHDGEFSNVKNYIEHVKCEYAERIGQWRQGSSTYSKRCPHSLQSSR